MSVPIAMLSTEGDLRKRSSASMLPRRMIERSLFGTSMPSVERPGMRSMRTDSALRASARSSCRLTIWLTLTPGAGWNSKTVITGPGLIASTVPSTPNSAQRVRISSPRRTSSTSSWAVRPSPICRRLTGGSVPGAMSPAKGSSFCGAGLGLKTGAAAVGAAAAGRAARGSAGKSSSSSASGDMGAAGTRRTANSASPFFSVTRPRMGRSRRSGGGAPTDTPAAAIDGRCASGAGGGVFFCFSSATRWRCLVITRRRFLSFSRRSCRRSRARVQFCQIWRRWSRQAASTLPSVDCTARAVPRVTAEASTTRVPARLSRDCRKSASSTPKAPPVLIEPSVQTMRPKPIWRRAGAEASSSAAPNPRPTTLGAPCRRSRRQPAKSRNRGIRKQVRPKNPNATAETCAPTEPAQLCA